VGSTQRDITEVLEDEEALVTPLLRLTPVAVLKG
jgi:tRNA-splicing ligase RtcB